MPKLNVSISILVLFFGCHDPTVKTDNFLEKKAEKTTSQLEKNVTGKKFTTNSSSPINDNNEKNTKNTSVAIVVNKLSSSEIVGLRPISSRSLSLKLVLKEDISAAFKPILKNNRRARYEVAAHHIAELLGVEGVPVATLRQVSLARLTTLLKKRGDHEMGEALTKRGLVDQQGKITGAMIEWIRGLQPNGLKEMGGKSKLFEWLSATAPVPEHPLASGASSMLTFDFLIGNWDRFSGGNLFVDRSGKQWVLIDNNGSFAPWSDRQKERMLGYLSKMNRFSADLVTRLRALTPSDINRALTQEPGHQIQPLLTKDEIALLIQRKSQILAHVDQLIARHGAELVLAF